MIQLKKRLSFLVNSLLDVLLTDAKSLQRLDSFGEEFSPVSSSGTECWHKHKQIDFVLNQLLSDANSSSVRANKNSFSAQLMLARLLGIQQRGGSQSFTDEQFLEFPGLKFSQNLFYFIIVQ